MHSVRSHASSSSLINNIQNRENKCNCLYLGRKTDYEIEMRLLSAQDKMIARSVNVWAGELRAELHALQSECDDMKYIARIDDIFHQAIFLLIGVGDNERAKELAYTVVNKYIALWNRYKNQVLQNYITLFWLQVIRIDRLTGNSSDAFSKHKLLSSTNHDVLSQVHFERVQLYLHCKNDEALINYLELRPDNFYYSGASFYREAYALMLIKQSRISEALQVLSSRHVSGLTKIIFELRKYEVGLTYPGIKIVQNTLYMKNQMLSYADLMKESVSVIQLFLYWAKILKNINELDLAKSIIQSCIEHAMAMEDEMVTADGLAMLYSLVANDSEGRHLEDKMIKLYYKTGYKRAQNKLIKTYPDLQYVENNDDLVDLHFLCEDLYALTYIGSI